MKWLLPVLLVCCAVLLCLWARQSGRRFGRDAVAGRVVLSVVLFFVAAMLAVGQLDHLHLARYA